MYARATAFRMKADAQEEVVAHLEEIRRSMANVDGLLHAHIMWNERDGHGQTVGIYKDQAAADAAMPVVQKIWQKLAPHMQEAPMAVGYARVETLVE